MEKTRRIHDGIVGTMIVTGTALGFYLNPVWFWLPGLIGVLMILSMVTGFCPVYFLLGKCGFCVSGKPE